MNYRRAISRKLTSAASAMRLVEREMKSPTRRRPALWRAGFLSESAVLYSERDGRYVSDADRWFKTRHFNHTHAITTMSSKLLFHYYYSRAGLEPRLPALRGVVVDGVEWQYSDGRLRPGSILPGDVAVKPISGNSGKGVFVTDTLSELSGTLKGHLVQSRVKNHVYASTIWPDALNTLRLLVVRDSDGIPFLSAAVHRFGSSRSPNADNWSAGGLSAAISSDGRLGPAVGFPVDGQMRWLDAHPDTGATITGVEVPEWRAVQALALDAAALLPGANWVGWDIAVTEDGPVMIEGNNVPDVNLMQVHGPLLADLRTRKAFEHWTTVKQRA